jgi:hypothetical protein
MGFHNQQIFLKVCFNLFYNKIQQLSKINKEANLDLITDLDKETKI